MTYPALARALEYALRSGVEIPKPLLDSACKALGIPRRDRLEPGRLEKEKAEDRVAAVIKRRFNRQKARVRQHLEMYHPYRKDINHTDEELQSWLEDNPEDGDDATRIAILLSKAARGGVKLFDMNVDLGGEFALTNTEAAKWAATYVYDLIRGIDQTTLEAMRNAISTFVSTPGYTIGDVMDLLPFNSERARRVAVTEITRAYAEGNQLAAGALAEQFPGVRVTKRWYTNQDDRVCEVCGPLGDQEPIDQDESWTTVDGDELENPPAHVNCRCWTSYSTDIEG
jgi:hypothetical protein